MAIPIPEEAPVIKAILLGIFFCIFENLLIGQI
jgi:hypothetical protein